MLPSSRHPLEAVVRDRDGRQLARCAVRRGRYIIGSGQNNEIVVEETSISGRHARLTLVSDDEIYIEDLGSANGTRVAGAAAEKLTPIAPGARVTVGGCVLDFQRRGLPAAVFGFLPEGFLRESRYNFGEAVVEGSTSTIFSAFDTTLGRDIAIKVLRPESQVRVDHVLRFIREAQITSQLQHPCIPTVYELGLNDQSQLYYTTCFVEGGSLGDVLDSLSGREPGATERFPLTRLLVAFQKICDAVAYAHSRGVIHAALRPETVTLGFYGEVLAVSWCFARVLTVAPDGHTLPRPVVAAPSDSACPLSTYTAPEIAAGAWSVVNARTDVYSLGAILYRMVTLHRPITFEDEGILRDAITHGDIRNPAPFALEPHPHCPGGRYPAPLMAIALKALNIEPANRHQSVQELQAAVAAWQQGLAH
ncbi:MAG: FHA domain-containing serine/threonine-protein kinase [Chthoniobacteraceae bacterium]